MKRLNSILKNTLLLYQTCFNFVDILKEPVGALCISNQTFKSTLVSLVWLSENKRKRKDTQILPRELKKLWNIKLTVIWNVVGALGTVHKQLEKRLEIWGKIDAILITVLLKLARILRRMLETWEDMLDFRGKTAR